MEYDDDDDDDDDDVQLSCLRIMSVRLSINALSVVTLKPRNAMMHVQT